MSKPVKTPAGKGQIIAATQLIDGWRLHVKLSSGGIWTGSVKELKGARDAEAVKEFRRELGEEVAD